MCAAWDSGTKLCIIDLCRYDVASHVIYTVILLPSVHPALIMLFQPSEIIHHYANLLIGSY